jgi:hypothetical protein
MTTLGRRLQSLESRISSGSPKVIFIMPYVDPSDQISGIVAAVRGNSYSYSGSSLDEILNRAEAGICASSTGLICELVFVDVRTGTSG